MPWVLQARQLMTWSACGAVCLLPPQQHQDWTEEEQQGLCMGMYNSPSKHTLSSLFSLVTLKG